MQLLLNLSQLDPYVSEAMAFEMEGALIKGYRNGMDAYGWFTAIITNWFSPIRIVGGLSLTGASMGVYSAAANSASESVSGRTKQNSGEPKLLLLRLALFPEKTQSFPRFLSSRESIQ
ncbi:hypothetical protein SUGI_1491400 [Cryptomeria japonica]|uniref:Uncharacterized protein n=1 Tax=Cryptomeria japonica TaxID=3369 RepID=A0AAD3NNN1_CRYJA|nr:hypothetical protein SUGI_1373360 [Cryptomeria japonica]GLJ59075.1 hypothetical protein SUGI_1491400 [Cryptomeria japonica]